MDAAGNRFSWDNKQIHVAMIVSNIADDDAATRAIASLAKHHDASKIKLHVYSTEAGVRREKQFFAAGHSLVGSAKRGISTLESLGQKKIPAWLCPIEGDIVSGAKELANQMIRDRIDVAIFDATQADAIAAVVVELGDRPRKINLCRRSPLYSPQINAITYTDQARFNADKDFWAKRNIDARLHRRRNRRRRNHRQRPEPHRLWHPRQRGRARDRRARIWIARSPNRSSRR